MISIHASREGSDHWPARNASQVHDDFNPRFPRGKRPAGGGKSYILRWISIHASREGSDLFDFGEFIIVGQFQSTLPAREATSPPAFT